MPAGRPPPPAGCTLPVGSPGGPPPPRRERDRCPVRPRALTEAALPLPPRGDDSMGAPPPAMWAMWRAAPAPTLRPRARRCRHLLAPHGLLVPSASEWGLLGASGLADLDFCPRGFWHQHHRRSELCGKGGAFGGPRRKLRPDPNLAWWLQVGARTQAEVKVVPRPDFLNDHHRWKRCRCHHVDQGNPPAGGILEHAPREGPAWALEGQGLEEAPDLQRHGGACGRDRRWGAAPR